MDLRHLRQVCSLIEHGNFHRAAEDVGLTQPALTKSLQQLERELGVSLFDRHGKTVSPTVFGEVVGQTAKDVLAAIDGMERRISQLADLDAGELSIGAGPYVADVWLGQVTGRLLKRFPRLAITLHVDTWDKLPDALKRGEIDFLVAHVDHLRDVKDFHVVPFPPVQGIWVSRGDHPLALEEVPPANAIVEYPLIGPPVPDNVMKWLEAAAGRTQLVLRRIDTTSVTMIKAMIREGEALSCVHPDSVRSEIASGEFVKLNFDAPPVYFNPGLAWLADRSLSPASTAFARELFAEVGVDPAILDPAPRDEAVSVSDDSSA